MLQESAESPLLPSSNARVYLRRITGRVSVCVVTIAIVAKALILQNLLWPLSDRNPADTFDSLFNVGTRSNGREHRIALKQVDVEEDAKQRWAYHRMDGRYGSSLGGGGMPLAAAGVSRNDSASEELKRQQFEKVIGQFERDESTGQDFVVNASTGRPVPLTDQQKIRLKRIRETKKANEQSMIDSFAFAYEDNYVPTKYIYPDGEDMGPKAYDNIDLTNVAPHLSDRHVSANGKVSEHEGDVFGVFRPGVFGPPQPPVFNNFGESFGFADRPLQIRDVNYQRQAEIRSASLRNYEFNKNGKIVDPKTGSTVPGQDNVGPDSMVATANRRMGMDREVDPETGEELPGCIGPQCNSFRLDAWNMPDLDSRGGSPDAGFEEDQRTPGVDSQDNWDKYDAPPSGTSAFGGSVPPDKGLYSEGDSKIIWEPNSKNSGGWIKQWNAGSWIGFVLIGPVLTCGVSTFVFLVRGPVWGLFVFIAMVVLDVLIFYFG